LRDNDRHAEADILHSNIENPSIDRTTQPYLSRWTASPDRPAKSAYSFINTKDKHLVAAYLPSSLASNSYYHVFAWMPTDKAKSTLLELADKHGYQLAGIHHDKQDSVTHKNTAELTGLKRKF
jgi:hypothetical protein